jgi:hypothetical protein
VGERGDGERQAARRERAAADLEHSRAEEHSASEPTHRRVERKHREASNLHERAARLFDAHDDPAVTEREAIEIADDVFHEGLSPRNSSRS